MKLYVTPASSFVRKVRITILELGIEDRFEFIQTRWPWSWGTQTVPFRSDFAAATPVGRIPALVTGDGIHLTDSSVICEYLDAEFGNYRLCPERGSERWRILSVISMANAVMEAQAARRAEQLRLHSDKPQEFSKDFETKMMDRQMRCYGVLDAMAPDFRREPDLGQIALAAACGISDFNTKRWGDIWRPGFPRLTAWFDTFRQRPSMLSTEPAETPRDPDASA
jgi:glutathione S-transferase